MQHGTRAGTVAKRDSATVHHVGFRGEPTRNPFPISIAASLISRLSLEYIWLRTTTIIMPQISVSMLILVVFVIKILIPQAKGTHSSSWMQLLQQRRIWWIAFRGNYTRALCRDAKTAAKDTRAIIWDSADSYRRERCVCVSRGISLSCVLACDADFEGIKFCSCASKWKPSMYLSC